MQRPSSVPAEANWDPNDNEWVLGSQDEQGEFHGEVRYWRPDGTLCNRCDFVHGTTHGTFERFHENGEVSQAGTFDDGDLILATYFRTDSETTEVTPPGAPENMWRMQMFMEGGRPFAARGYDRDGNTVPSGGPSAPDGIPEDAVPFGNRWCHGPCDEAMRPHGRWTMWDESGRPRGHMDFDRGRQVAVHELAMERPTGVAADAVFDEEGEVWVQQSLNEAGEVHGEKRVWLETGRLIAIEEYDRDFMVQERIYLEDGSLASDCSYNLGMPRRRFFRRTAEDSFHNFPNVQDEHPTAMEVEYTFDDHGFMAGFQIRGASGDVLENETLYNGPGNHDRDQKRFGSIDEASKAWRAAGDNYTTALNAWLKVLYSEEEQTEEEPEFEGSDLQRAYIESVESMNAQGQSAHEKFPTYHDGIHGFFWDQYGREIDNVVHLGDAIYARVEEPHGPVVYQIAGSKVNVQAGVHAVGVTRDKAFAAFAMNDGIAVVNRNNELVQRFSYPRDYGYDVGAPATKLGNPATMKIQELVVLRSGQELLMATAEGTYHLTTSGPRRLYPLDSEMAEYVEEFDGDDGESFSLDVQRPNVALSPNEALVACGGFFHRGIFAPHAVFERNADVYALRASSQENAFFPGPTTFHSELPTMAFSATLYASLSNQIQNTTFRLDLADLPGAPSAAAEITEFSGAVWQGPAVVNCTVSYGDGFLCGLSNGYIYWMGAKESGDQKGYVHLGGSITSIDISPDQKEWLVASDTGMLTRLRLGEGQGGNLITDMNIKDAGRVAFWSSFAPLHC